jgi:hypothetical protein
MAAPDLRTLAAAALRQLAPPAPALCPAVPPLGNGTSGQAPTCGGFLLRSAVPGAHVSGNEAGQGPAVSVGRSVPHRPATVPVAGTCRDNIRPSLWLVTIGRAVAAALADGAEREADAAGWVLLVRTDGARLVVAPHIVAELDAARHLPALPEAVERSTYAARARPAEWWDGNDEPKAGDRCRCGGRRFWTERDRLGGWRCSTCHPPPPGLAVTPMKT